MMKTHNNGYKGVVLGWALGWALLGVGPCGAEEPAKAATPSTQVKVSTDDLFKQAEQARKAGQLDQAVALLNQLLERDPQNVKAYLARARSYSDQKKSAQAIADYQQAVKLDPKNADVQGNLGWQLILEGRFDEAREPTEKAHALAPDSFTLAINLGDLALLAGDPEQARRYYRRGLEKINSSEEFEQGPIADLELFIQKGWQVDVARKEITWLREAFAPRQKWLTLEQQRRKAQGARDYPTAENIAREALDFAETSFGPEHPDTATILNNLAGLLQDLGRLAEAEPLYRRATVIVGQTQRLDSQLISNRNLGRFLVKRQQLKDALPYYRTASEALDRLFANTQGLSEEARHTFLGQHAYIYREFLELLLKLHEQDAQAGYDREFLAVASRNQSRIFSELLRQGDVQRFAQDPKFLALKDQRQTLLNQLQTLREKRALLPITAPNVEAQKADFSQQIDALATDLKAVEDTLRRDYPRYLELLQPTAITVEHLQRELLRPGEALLNIVLLPEKTVLLVVTPQHFTLHALPPTQSALTAQITTLRAALQLDNQGGLSALRQLDPAALHQLYQSLIAPLEPTLKDAKRLLVIADGPLYSLPLELLLTGYDDAQKARFETAQRQADGSHPDRALLSQYRDLPYLGDRYTFRYLPSLAALAAQRRYPKPPVPAAQPAIAFADPVFDPAESDQKTAPLTPDTQHTLALLKRSGALNSPLPRLPQTADEARALQTALPGAPPPYLRQAAQEATLKQLAKDGKLRGLRYLLLATHGLLGGEFIPSAPKTDPEPVLLDLNGPRRAAPTEPLGQPALALTLVNPLDGQDGFLTLKDVIEDLDLNTDLAILSACNTAGDSAKSATGEGFAGMTRAFLFAGARHLWVSHWSVESVSTRDLITAALQAREAGTTDPATALAQAQKALRTRPAQTFGETLQGQPVYLDRAHPFFWAAFVTVGD